MGFFANNPQMLQLTKDEIVEKVGTYRSKLPLSSKHQLLCYLYGKISYSNITIMSHFLI